MGSSDQEHQEEDSLDFARDIWNEAGRRAFLSAGAHEPEKAVEMVKRYGGAAVFGRFFISNPDLPVGE
jgi:2,4-dienoyl-CoA reductase-like NADH-dependent reductase (Old Yellow Enzyme family)